MLSRNWYAIRVKPRREFQAHRELGLRGIETFVPTQRVRRRWPVRTKIVSLPLFPGYLFGMFSTAYPPRGISGPGLEDLILPGLAPIPLCGKEVESLRLLMASKMSLRRWPFGEAEAHAADDPKRMVVALTALERAVAAEFETSAGQR